MKKIEQEFLQRSLDSAHIYIKKLQSVITESPKYSYVEVLSTNSNSVILKFSLYNRALKKMEETIFTLDNVSKSKEFIHNFPAEAGLFSKGQTYF